MSDADNESFRLLEQAEEKRGQAKRCRSILKDMSDTRAIELLTRYALELEEGAEVLERLAGDTRGRPGNALAESKPVLSPI